MTEALIVDQGNYHVLSVVDEEMSRQDERRGQQDHRDLGVTWRSELYPDEAEDWKETNEARVKRGPNWVAWDGLLLEEVYEALSEPDDDKRCEGLTQVAAVALQWVKAIRRRQAAARDS